MRQKFVITLAAAAAIVGGVALMPTEASAWCRCGAYYTYGWYPAWRTAYATYQQPVLVKRPVTTYVYQWKTRPVRYAYARPVLAPVAVAWYRPRVRVIAWRGRPRILAYGL
jgi:hypothetical protein